MNEMKKENIDLMEIVKATNKAIEKPFKKKSLATKKDINEIKKAKTLEELKKILIEVL